MKRTTFCWIIIVVVGIIGSFRFPAIAVAQPPTNLYRIHSYVVDSGTHDGLKGRTYVAFREVIRIPETPWLQLSFSDYNLGQQSYLTITSLLDGSQQRLDAKSLPQWGNKSALLSGEAVQVELHVAPGEQGIFFRIEEVATGELVGKAPAIPTTQDVQPQTLCDADNRVASNDGRVGRLRMQRWTATGLATSVCTAWLVSNGSVLTAGHCVDWDPDGGGDQLPDGTLNLIAGDVVEFNVPASTSSGTIMPSATNDRYTIDLNSVEWNFDGAGEGFGKDWAILALNPNVNTGRTAFQTQSDFFRMTRTAPDSAATPAPTIRVTGYGLDDTPAGTGGGENADHHTNQTHTGAYLGESSSGDDIWHTYRVDTQGGNSGSPVIWEDNGFTIGIHTNAGCTATSGTGNRATSFEHDPLENALQGFHGTNTVYVDRDYPKGLTPNPFALLRSGLIFDPYVSVATAVDMATDGAIITIVRGSYDETLTIDKNVTLIAPVGPVVDRGVATDGGVRHAESRPRTCQGHSLACLAPTKNHPPALWGDGDQHQQTMKETCPCFANHLFSR